MNLPPHLYKYYEFNERSISVMVKNVIYFAHAEQFNDPFDCRIRLNYTGRDEDWKVFLGRTLRECDPTLTTAQIESMIDQKIREGQLRDEKNFEHWEEETRRHQLNKSRILSLSADPALILMWSHYAGAHQGCCLKFSTKQAFFKRARRVHYPRSYPNVRFLDCVDDRAKFVKTMLLTKSKLWKYEKEWRIIGDEPRLYKYDPVALTGIIFGFRMKPEHKDLIGRLVGKRNPPVQLYQAIPWKHKFKMQIVPLP
jgi:hypothetical protein